jgi:hypothetical protein
VCIENFIRVDEGQNRLKWRNDHSAPSFWDESNDKMTAKVNPLAGKPAPASMLVNVSRLITAYFFGVPDPAIPWQRVLFGTSGHRGSAFNCTFNEAHVLAIAQAICLYRQRGGINGPLFVGMDTHALSEPAFASALEVFAANDVETMIDGEDGYTPTPVISHAILSYNKGRTNGLAPPRNGDPSHRLYGRLRDPRAATAGRLIQTTPRGRFCVAQSTLIHTNPQCEADHLLKDALIQA